MTRTGFLPYSPPLWANDLPHPPTTRVSLGLLPTPVHRWEPPALPSGYQLWIKRDDVTGLAVSGNKIRKLEFLLAQALEQGCDCVITCGGIQSNHCRTTAAAARTLGLDSYLLLRTQDPQLTQSLVGNLLIDHMVGAQLIPISYEQYRRRATLMDVLAEELRQQGRNPYLIPEGGSNALGTWGYVEAIRELQQQVTQQHLEISDLVVACGSGGTVAGLALGSALARAPWEVHAINVCDDAAYFYAIVNQIYRDLQAPFRAEDTLHIIDGYKGLGYAISREEELQLLRDVAQSTGILLDPVYTGKAVYGLMQELSQHTHSFQGQHILFVHTGGLFGLYEKAAQLQPLFSSQPLLHWAEHR